MRDQLAERTDSDFCSYACDPTCILFQGHDVFHTHGNALVALSQAKTRSLKGSLMSPKTRKGIDFRRVRDLLGECDSEDGILSQSPIIWVRVN